MRKNKKTNEPSDLFCRIVNSSMKKALEDGGFESMDELFEEGCYDLKETDEVPQKSKRKYIEELLKEYGCKSDYDGISVDELFGKGNYDNKSRFRNNALQVVYTEMFNIIANDPESVKIMKDFSDEIAYYYGDTAWYSIFNEYQRFFIMMWKMNPPQADSDDNNRTIVLTKKFCKSIGKLRNKLIKRIKNVDTNQFVLSYFYETMLSMIKQDKTAFMQMIELNNGIAKDFGTILWYTVFNEVERFIIVCLEANMIYAKYAK